VQTAEQMHGVVMSHVAGQDVFIAVAAVADWRVTKISEHKMKKDEHGGFPQIEFELNPDILAEVATLPNRPYCVGFAAESEQLMRYGEEKRKKKGVPLLVGNIGHNTFGKDQNELMLFDDNGHTHLPKADKQKLARQLIAEIVRRIG